MKIGVSLEKGGTLIFALYLRFTLTIAIIYLVNSLDISDV